MASTLELLAPTGLTLTVELYPHGSDAIANTGGDSLTEATNRKGLYTATVAETLSGWHTAHIKLSGTVITAGDVLMVDSETCRVRDHDPKADVAFVSGTAQTAGDLAAILTAIKGAGWTTESLKAIKDAVDAIDPLDATETQAAAAAAIAADKTGYKLAADGLDAIADPDDLTAGSVPATFTQKLRWLIQRFWRADKTPTQITVKSEAGNTITTQAVTDDQAGTETLGTPT